MHNVRYYSNDLPDLTYLKTFGMNGCCPQNRMMLTLPEQMIDYSGVLSGFENDMSSASIPSCLAFSMHNLGICIRYSSFALILIAVTDLYNDIKKWRNGLT